MKVKIIFGLIGLLPSIGSSFTVSVNNQAVFSDPSLPLVDNAGNLLSGGVLGVGFFASDADVTNNATDFTALLNTFQEYGTSVGFTSGAADGLLNVDTPANWNIPVPPGSTDPQVGQNVYVVIGNGTSLSSSTELAVWRSDQIFGTDDALGNGGLTVEFETGEGDLLLGTANGTTQVTSGVGSITYSDGIRLTTASAIPEPSSAFLMGLAALGFAGRRRR